MALWSLAASIPASAGVARSHSAPGSAQVLAASAGAAHTSSNRATPAASVVLLRRPAKPASLRATTYPAAAGHNPRPMDAKRALVALTLLGGALRFATLDLQSFWLDEAVTVELVRLDLSSMLHPLPHRDASPPPYYVRALVWTAALG